MVLVRWWLWPVDGFGPLVLVRSLPWLVGDFALVRRWRLSVAGVGPLGVFIRWCCWSFGGLGPLVVMFRWWVWSVAGFACEAGSAPSEVLGRWWP